MDIPLTDLTDHDTGTSPQISSKSSIEKIREKVSSHRISLFLNLLQNYKNGGKAIEYGNYASVVYSGFIKVTTFSGLAYWTEQAMRFHQTPDWKIHISVKPQDIPRAWSIIVKHFIEKKCPLVMKGKHGQWAKHMNGREFTIYLYNSIKTPEPRQKIPVYYRLDPDDKTETELLQISQLGRRFVEFKSTKQYKITLWAIDKSSSPENCSKFKQMPANYWRKFIIDLEKELQSNKIQPNGCAIGDLPIGEYSSLRNETMVYLDEKLVYPPNCLGWNAAHCEDTWYSKLKMRAPTPQEKSDALASFSSFSLKSFCCFNCS